MTVSPDKKVLILGGSGFVGRHLFDRMGPRRAVATYCRNAFEGGLHFDAASDDVAALIEKTGNFTHAVILFGDTNPDACARDSEHSTVLNVTRTRAVLDGLKSLRIIPVFISSEAVFDGAKGDYREDDKPNPILTYGRQKLEVEHYIQATHEKFLIVRLSRVFGSTRGDGTLFTDWLKEIEKKGPMRCAQDQVFSPIHVEDVIEGLIRLIDQNEQGIFHLAGTEAHTRLDMLKTLLARYQKQQACDVEIIPCRVEDFPTLEKRPLNVSLMPDKIIRATGLNIRDLSFWCDAIVTKWFADDSRAK